MEFKLEEAIPVLERTPEVLSALLDELPERWTRAREGPDAWSPSQIVGHLINGERTDWIPRARIILKQESYSSGIGRCATGWRNSSSCARETWPRSAAGI